MTAEAGDSTVIARNTLDGSIGSGGEKVLFDPGFRTSRFNTFADKINAMTGYRELYAVEHSLMSLPAINGNMSETFDSYELTGNGEDQPALVYAEAVRNNNSWLNGHVYPLVYELYGSDPSLTLDRDVGVMGLMPLKGMWIFNDAGDDYRLEETQKTSGIAQSRAGGVTFRYNVAYHVYRDYAELRDKAAAKYVGTNAPVSEAARRLLNGTLRDIDPGQYAFRLNYRLPGMENPVSGREYGFNYLTGTL